MTPVEFMAEIALPTVLEFKAEQRSRRRAYLACIAAFHLKDHLRKAGETGVETSMRTAAGDLFDAVRGVCNGTKHVLTDASHPIAFKAGDDYDVLPSTFGSFLFGRSTFGDTVGGRQIARGPGESPVTLYWACAEVLRAYVTAYPSRFAGCDLTAL